MKNKISIVLNSIIVILSIIGTIFMLEGIEFMGPEHTLAATRIEMFKFYTVDSNILMGVVSAVFIVFELRLIKGKIDIIPTQVYVLKLIGTVGVTLTFLTVVLYLGHIAENGFFSMFMNTNLFFHFIIPVLSMITFIFLEKTDQIKFKHTFIGTTTMLVYAVFYVINILLHIENGKVSPKYDWYWFVQQGIWSMIIVLPLMIVFTYIISLCLWKLNKKR